MYLTHLNSLSFETLNNLDTHVGQMKFGLNSGCLTLKQGELLTLSKTMAGAMDIDENFIQSVLFKLNGFFSCNHESLDFKFADSRKRQAVYTYTKKQGDNDA